VKQLTSNLYCGFGLNRLFSDYPFGILKVFLISSSDADSHNINSKCPYYRALAYILVTIRSVILENIVFNTFSEWVLC